MRILLANHTPVFGSGSGTYTAMVARGLSQAGHDVCILTPQAERFPVGAGVERRSVARLEQEFPSFTGHPLSSRTYDALDRRGIRSLHQAWLDAFEEIGRSWRPDLVHAQHLWVVAKAAVSAGFRPVVTCHGSAIEFAAAHPAVAKSLLPAFDRLGGAIAISRYVAGKASSFLEQVPARYTLANPYDEERFYFEPGRHERSEVPHVGFVGRLVGYKNCDQFLECVARLRGEIPGIRASVIGGGADRRRLEDLARDLDLVPAVRFLGQLDQESLRHHYQGLDALIVPSREEPFGLVALEAVACGTPVIVAQSGGLSELIHPPYILGYESGDLGQLVARVLEVLSRPRDGGFWRDANAYVRRAYALQSYIRRIESVYRRVLDS